MDEIRRVKMRNEEQYVGMAMKVITFPVHMLSLFDGNFQRRMWPGDSSWPLVTSRICNAVMVILQHRQGLECSV